MTASFFTNVYRHIRRRTWLMVLSALVFLALIKFVYDVELWNKLVNAQSQLQPNLDIWYDNVGHRFFAPSILETPVMLDDVTSYEVSPSFSIAVYEHGGFHDEVVGAVIKSLEDVQANYTVYRDFWRFQFGQVVSTFAHSENANQITSRKLFRDSIDAGKHDLVFHITCDSKWDFFLPEGTWDTFDQSNVHVVCIIHELESIDDEGDRLRWLKLATEHRLTFMVLSPHSAKYLRHRLHKWTEEKGQMIWQSVPVESFLPIYPLDYDKLEPVASSDAVDKGLTNVPGKIPTDVAILGNVDGSRRNYNLFFQHLVESLQKDGSVWGYETPLPDATELIPLADGPPPFRLHLIGNLLHGYSIPEVLKKIIITYEKAPYPDFYRAIMCMDLIVPAFMGWHYIEAKISSAIPAGIMGRAPILATPLMARAYSFLRNPAIQLRPGGMSEVEAIRILRTGVNPWQLAVEERLVNDIPELSFTNPALKALPLEDQWDIYHASLYQYNARLFGRTLRRVEQGL